MRKFWPYLAVAALSAGTAASSRAGGGDRGRCENTLIHMTIADLGPQAQRGSVSDGAASRFAVGSGQTREITLPAIGRRSEYRVQAFLKNSQSSEAGIAGGSEEALCSDWVELPDGCPPVSAAARMYIYKTKHGYACFIRSVARRARESSVALNSQQPGAPER